MAEISAIYRKIAHGYRHLIRAYEGGPRNERTSPWLSVQHSTQAEAKSGLHRHISSHPLMPNSASPLILVPRAGMPSARYSTRRPMMVSPRIGENTLSSATLHMAGASGIGHGNVIWHRKRERLSCSSCIRAPTHVSSMTGYTARLIYGLSEGGSNSVMASSPRRSRRWWRSIVQHEHAPAPLHEQPIIRAEPIEQAQPVEGNLNR